MKYIFTSASKKAPDFVLNHPNQLTVDLPKSSQGWTMAGESYKTPESWLEGVRRKLLLLGISDVQCASATLTNTPKIEHRFHFYFGSEFERYQFQAAILPDAKGVFKREIQALTPEKSLEQEINIKKFADEIELNVYILRTAPTSITVRTERNHDDLIIAINKARGKFDRHIEHFPEQQTKVARLLLGNSTIEESAPKNVP